MQAFCEDLRKFMEANALSQAQLAVNAGVSQGTISRALRRKPARYSAAMNRLCNYASIKSEDSLRFSAQEAVRVAFERVWDGTNEHALAITRIIEATNGLAPRQD